LIDIDIEGHQPVGMASLSGLRSHNQ